MTLRRTFAILLCLLLASVVPAAAQSWAGRGRLQGEVSDQNGKPIEGAKITLTKKDVPDSAPPPATTNAKGKWSVGGLAGGDWMIVIEKENFVGSEGMVKVSEFGPAPAIRVKLNPITEEMRRAAEPQVNPAVAAIEAGNALLVAGKYAEARAEYERAMTTLDAENQTNVKKGIARTYMMEKNSAAALGLANELLAFNPADLDALKIKSQAQYDSKQLEDAITTLKAAIAISPADADLLNLISGLLVEVGREEEARQYMKQMPAGAKVDPVSLLNIGIRHYNAGKMEDALKVFEEVVVASPELADGYYYRGLAYLASGKMAEAKADFQKFRTIDPTHARAGDAKEFLKEM